MVVQLKFAPIKYARSIGVVVGEDCRFINIDIGTFGSEPYLIKIGNHVTITSGVRFITHDGGVWVMRRAYPNLDVVGSIEIGNNVFIGLNTILLPGTVILDNSVVGAGSVVSGKFNSDKVIAGVPAKEIKSLNEYQEKSLRNGINSRDKSNEEKKLLFKKKTNIY